MKAVASLAGVVLSLWPNVSGSEEVKWFDRKLGVYSNGRGGFNVIVESTYNKESGVSDLEKDALVAFRPVVIKTLGRRACFMMKRGSIAVVQTDYGENTNFKQRHCFNTEGPYYHSPRCEIKESPYSQNRMIAKSKSLEFVSCD